MNQKNRLRKSAAFDRVYKGGTSRADKLLVLYVLPNGMAEARLGVSVSKKVGNSVARHKIKRRVKEVFRQELLEIAQGTDCIVVARAAAKDSNFEEIRSSLTHLAAGLLPAKQKA